jgi:2-polyprenyl-3-methyl-5-hydroxy-6-metoxy-1,4-benzoquinol methylase
MTRCIACANATMRVAFRKGGCEILRCPACGLGRTLVPVDFDPSTYYSREYFEGGVTDGYADYLASERTLRAEFRHTLEWILRTTPARGTLLELGCAYGFFLQEARAHFASVHGVDVSADAAAFCRSRGLEVVAGVVDDQGPGGPYDVVVGLDVIEHLPEPQETLRVLASRMSPGGLIVMTTGDWAAFYPRVAGRRWRLMTPPQHLSFFTPASIGRLLENVGLRVLSITHPWRHVPLSLAAYQLQRFAGLRPRAIKGLERLALPINLWDTMRVAAVKNAVKH